MTAEDVVRLMEMLDEVNDTDFAHRVLNSIATKTSNLVLAEKLRIAEAIRDDARLASMNDIEAKRAAWAKGVQACIDMVKRRHEHYKQYQCDCNFALPTYHEPGCKGEMMQTRPATLAAYDEMFVFLSALLLRGEKP